MSIAMKLWSDTFKDGDAIPGEFAFAVKDPATHVRLSSNRNPHLAWNDVPAGTASLVLLCIDGDVPTIGDDVNQEGKTLPESMPRTDFFHWSLIDIPVSRTAIAAGEFSSAVTPRGKPGPEVASAAPLRQGVNDYTGWFAGDKDMHGDYFGYDGPCPPWNDERLHHYIFRLYALDIPRLELAGRFTGSDVIKAIHGHILDEAQIIGTYSLR
jgi:Raf kinase inhibitor-like YbhB/YbcL family protein